MKSIVRKQIREASGIDRGLHSETPEGLMLQGLSVIMDDMDAMLMSHPNMAKDIEDFHVKFDLPQPHQVQFLSKKLSEFREKFMQEELTEYHDAESLEKKLDALVDLIYVALGTAYLHGFSPKIFNEAWRRVHAANMKKVRAKTTIDSKRNSIFDVVKPEGWVAPNLSDLV